MTHEPTQTESTESTETLKDISHTNPFTDKAFGSTQVYDRGKMVAADGGEPSAATDDEVDDSDAAADGGRRETEADEDPDAERLEDVDHTPPRNAESANRVHERGHEGKDETV